MMGPSIGGGRIHQAIIRAGAKERICNTVHLISLPTGCSAKPDCDGCDETLESLCLVGLEKSI